MLKPEKLYTTPYISTIRRHRYSSWVGKPIYDEINPYEYEWFSRDHYYELTDENALVCCDNCNRYMKIWERIPLCHFTMEDGREFFTPDDYRAQDIDRPLKIIVGCLGGDSDKDGILSLNTYIYCSVCAFSVTEHDYPDLETFQNYCILVWSCDDCGLYSHRQSKSKLNQDRYICETCMQRERAYKEDKKRRTCRICQSQFTVNVWTNGRDVCYVCDDGKHKVIQSHNSRAKEYNLPATLTTKEWEETLEYFNHQCAYCQDVYSVLEHFYPLSLHIKGTEKSNCVPSCSSCNSSKGGRYPDMDNPSIKAVAVWLAQYQTP